MTIGLLYPFVCLLFYSFHVLYRYVLTYMDYCCDLCSALKNFVTVPGKKIADQFRISHASPILGPAMTLRGTTLSVLGKVALRAGKLYRQ